jgi:hypothetical protein
LAREPLQVHIAWQRIGEAIMALLGQGALVIWHDVRDETDYNEWHSKEHMLERVAVPGFRRGLRYVALAGSPRYLNLYEVDEVATLMSRPYLDRLNAPTPWTRRVLPTVYNNSRTLCRVVASQGGAGICAFLLTVQLAPERARADALRAWLSDEVLAQLAARPGVIGAHLLEGDQVASRTGTEEKRLRGVADAVAEWIVLVGGYDADALHAAQRDELADERLAAQSSATEPTVGLYQFLHAITEPDLARGA